jgi:hypothetical protein
MPMKRKISGMEAMKAAEYWLKKADGDRDDAVEFVRRYERGCLRQRTIIDAIDLTVRIREREESVGRHLGAISLSSAQEE